MKKIKALNKNIIVKRDKIPETTTNGLITSHTPGAKSLMCTVIESNDENIIVGDRLLLPNGVGYNFVFEGEDYTSIKFEDVIGRIK